jgi:hypothetical protein
LRIEEDQRGEAAAGIGLGLRDVDGVDGAGLAGDADVERGEGDAILEERGLALDRLDLAAQPGELTLDGQHVGHGETTLAQQRLEPLRGQLRVLERQLLIEQRLGDVAGAELLVGDVAAAGQPGDDGLHLRRWHPQLDMRLPVGLEAADHLLDDEAAELLDVGAQRGDEILDLGDGELQRAFDHQLLRQLGHGDGRRCTPRRTAPWAARAAHAARAARAALGSSTGGCHRGGQRRKRRLVRSGDTASTEPEHHQSCDSLHRRLNETAIICLQRGSRP